MTVTLTPDQVESITGIAGVTPESILSASWVITGETRWTTLTSMVDDGLYPTQIVEQAWAIVAARIYLAARGVGAESVTSESQGDYSVATDIASLEGYAVDPMRGIPRTLLGEGIGFTTELRPGQRLYT